MRRRFPRGLPLGLSLLMITVLAAAAVIGVLVLWPTRLAHPAFVLGKGTLAIQHARIYPSPTDFQLFGPTHLAILGVVLLLAAVLAILQRRLGSRWLRQGLAGAILLDSALYYGYLAMQGRLTFPDQLPLELCDASLFLVMLSLLTLRPAFFDLAYYWALAGATMALLTPNLLEPFPSFGSVQFFVYHGLVVSGTLYLVWSGLSRPRPGSVGRAMLWLNLFALPIGAFDFAFKTDYMYIRAKPENASLLSLLGPWPWYLLATEFVAFALFLLLYLPFWRRTVRAV